MTGRLPRGMPPVSRRAALRILGAGLAVPVGALALGGLSEGPVAVRWNGEALGAMAGMTLWHPDAGTARRTLVRLKVEIDRLERVFSLYRSDSEISRLNRAGRLAAPSRDLFFVLDESRRIAEASGGAFDPTIQPLWLFHTSGRAGGPGQSPADYRRDLAAARALVDYTALAADRREIRLGIPGMAISLNGIAQGYITDRICELLVNEGFESAVIELGETRALGAAPDGQSFAIGLRDPSAPQSVNREVLLSDRALAVSAGSATGPVGPDGRHIFDPATGLCAAGLREAVVTAPRAIWADAISTALYVAGEGAARRICDACPSVRASLTRADGTQVTL